MKNIFNLSKVIPFICISPYIITSIIVSIPPANAQSAAIGRQVSKSLARIWAENFAAGAGREAGQYIVVVATGAVLSGRQAQRFVNSGQTYVRHGIVYDYYGRPYRVCQHFQGNTPVSYVYYC
ncbi:hypothetical protein IQ224_03430 [Microcystis sp. LEGE 00066]|nr:MULTISPECIES: hypothetical protein [Microcystis]TRT96655.1 MAG: hypothetical protein EWV61_20295 [Microcystis aeruginosa Ma_AC_P_19900807_S300]ELS44685.1 hypothetical protein C789_5509 [Microcystis aeruginosa FACHB-905 = DIANCHI905]ELS44692.1 hypothetical protein C789_5516 [Microcystis aeruginosa FACHB-905 = DIANCHI905]MBE9261310.1 hypothetical protein [Microcystis sp. LEGE 00066]UGS07719.1 P1 family peptidase [Microcystis aeruginosa FACHB-905 = DIANCHI905]